MANSFKKEKKRLKACIVRLKELAIQEKGPAVFDDENGLMLLTLVSSGLSTRDWQSSFYESELEYSEYLDGIIKNDLIPTKNTVYQIILIKGTSSFSTHKSTKIICDISLGSGLDYLCAEATLLVVNYFIKENNNKINFDWVTMIRPTNQLDLNYCTYCLRLPSKSETCYLLPIRGMLGAHNWNVFANASFQIK